MRPCTLSVSLVPPPSCRDVSPCSLRETHTHQFTSSQKAADASLAVFLAVFFFPGNAVSPSASQPAGRQAQASKQVSKHQFTLEKEGSTFTRGLSIYKRGVRRVSLSLLPPLSLSLFLSCLAVVQENRPTSFHSLPLYQECEITERARRTTESVIRRSGQSR